MSLLKPPNSSQSFLITQHVYQTWQTSFHTEDKEEVERIVAKDDSETELLWQANGDLRIVTNRRAFAEVPQSMLEGDAFPKDTPSLMMNQILAFHPSLIYFPNMGSNNIYFPWKDLPYDERPFHSRWGDGTELTDEELLELTSLYEKFSKTIPLKTGQLIVLNNFWWGHGRKPYCSTLSRKLLVVMSSLVNRG